MEEKGRMGRRRSYAAVDATGGPVEQEPPSGRGLIQATARSRRHHLGGAPGNPEPPVKVEAAGRRGRAEARGDPRRRTRVGWSGRP